MCAYNHLWAKRDKWILESHEINRNWTPEIGDEVTTFSGRNLIIIGLIKSRESGRLLMLRAWQYASPGCFDSLDDDYWNVNMYEVRLVERRPQ